MAKPAPKKEKKGDKKHAGPILGRPGNNVKIGIVGLPNIGKSSFFNTLSTKQVPAENYPFCTIEPSKAQVGVPDERLDYLIEKYNPKSRVQAVLTVWDIAGLVKGAHEGRGLGNEFLANISAIDAIYHLVRGFKDKHVEHVEGSLDPIRDMEIISSELRAKDLNLIDKKIESVEKLVKRTTDKRIKEEFEVLQKIQQVLKEGKDVQFEQWSPKEVEYINTYNLFTAKKVVFLVNVSEENWLEGKNKWIVDIKTWVKKNCPGSPVIPFCATFEKKIQEMNEEERAAYLKEHKTKSMLTEIIHAGYKALRLVHFFTAGEDEVKAWTIREGTKAPQAAGTIHTDFEKGFICAECMNFEDFKHYGSEAEAKKAGKYQQKGRDYEVQDGDILLFKFNN